MQRAIISIESFKHRNNGIEGIVIQTQCLLFVQYLTGAVAITGMDY